MVWNYSLGAGGASLPLAWPGAWEKASQGPWPGWSGESRHVGGGGAESLREGRADSGAGGHVGGVPLRVRESFLLE